MRGRERERERVSMYTAQNKMSLPTKESKIEISNFISFRERERERKREREKERGRERKNVNIT